MHRTDLGDLPMLCVSIGLWQDLLFEESPGIIRAALRKGKRDDGRS